MWLLGVLGGFLEGSWVDLGLKSQKMCKNNIRGPPWPPQDGPKIHQKFIKNRAGSLPKNDNFFEWLCGRVLVPCGTNLDPTWPPKPSQNRSKLVPKSIKKEIKMLTKFLRYFSSLWGRSCVNFPSKLEGRGSQKDSKNHSFEAFLLFQPTFQQEAI